MTINIKRSLYYLVAIATITYAIYRGCLHFSASGEHQRKLKKLNGFVTYEETQWANPGAGFSVNTKDKHGLIRYESGKPGFFAKIKEDYNFSMKPVFEQEPDGTRNIYLEIYTNTSLAKDCEILFESGTKRQYKIEFLRTNGPIKELKYYGIKLTPEEYYLYFVKDTPQRITVTAFTGFSNTEYFLTGRHHEFIAFHDMGSFFTITPHTPRNVSLLKLSPEKMLAGIVVGAALSRHRTVKKSKTTTTHFDNPPIKNYNDTLVETYLKSKGMDRHNLDIYQIMKDGMAGEVADYLERN